MPERSLEDIAAARGASAGASLGDLSTVAEGVADGRSVPDYEAGQDYREGELVVNPSDVLVRALDDIEDAPETFNAAQWEPITGEFDGIPLAEKGEPEGVAELDAAGKVPADQLPPSDNPSASVISFSQPGVLATGVGKGRFRFPTAAEVESVEVLVDTAPDGQPVIFDLNTVDAANVRTTLFTTQAERPTVQIAENALVDGTRGGVVTAAAASDDELYDPLSAALVVTVTDDDSLSTGWSGGWGIPMEIG